jgi:hypothetical protein
MLKLKAFSFDTFSGLSYVKSSHVMLWGTQTVQLKSVVK